MPKTVVCIKVDPILRQVARIAIKPSIAGVRAVLGASDFGHRVILEDCGGRADGEPGEMLLLAARFNVNRDHPFKEWRFRGGENTVGKGLLFGTYNRNEAGPGMWHCPVTVEWVLSRIIWCNPGDDAPAAEVAQAMGIPHVEEKGAQLAPEKTGGVRTAPGADGEGIEAVVDSNDERPAAPRG